MPKQSARVTTLIQGLKDLWGEEAVLRLLSNSLVAEEIARAALKHPVSVIEAALVDARAAHAQRWAWVAERLRRSAHATPASPAPASSPARASR